MLSKKTMSKTLLAVLWIGLFSFAGCGGDDDPTTPGGGDGGENNNGTGTVTATVDGVSWSAVVAQAVNNSGIIGIGASDTSAQTTIGIGWLNTGANSYTIGPGSTANGTVVSAGGSGWHASGDVGSGTLNVTTLTATRVAGTFSFSAVRYTGTEDPVTIQVTNGAFDVNF